MCNVNVDHHIIGEWVEQLLVHRNLHVIPPQLPVEGHKGNESELSNIYEATWTKTFQNCSESKNESSPFSCVCHSGCVVRSHFWTFFFMHISYLSTRIKWSTMCLSHTSTVKDIRKWKKKFHSYSPDISILFSLSMLHIIDNKLAFIAFITFYLQLEWMLEPWSAHKIQNHSKSMSNVDRLEYMKIDR